MSKEPTYGTSTHYSGDAGVEYFNWQDASGVINGKINARKFENSVEKNSIVLDFGCGGGHLIDALDVAHKVGVEINPIASQEASKYCDEIFTSIEDVPSSSIDVVISNHALEHVPYPILALKEMKRVLKNRGKIIICVPIDDWRTQKKYSASDINHHLNTWTPQLLGNSLVEAGFDPELFEISILHHAWFPTYLKYWNKTRFFDFLCFIYSIKVKRRQLIVTART